MRAAKALLLLGGLVVLGFVLGGQAHAVERPGVPAGVPSAGSAGPVRQLNDDTRSVAGEAVNGTLRLVTERTERTERDVVRPVAEPVVEQVVRPVAQPADDAVTEATESVGDVVGEVVEGTAARPLPAPAPGLPGAGPRPVPGLDLTGGGVQYGPQTGFPAGPRPGVTLAETPGTERSAATARCSGPVGLRQFGPFHDARALADAARDDRSPILAGGPGDVPFPRYPGRSPAAPHGAAVLQTAGDSHPPRPGDQPAAWFQDAPASTLLPGSGQPEAASGVPDRRREIPEFPG
ncbi:hypothetical protein QMZ92_06605 [Streptomyces sp. HNM0645]|uniref:hypothetical protein n=1 Tax=Streptomyces sp. HNM0645 TaxID=2782343 RepID=UPI0024B6ECE6|nr:hypothetical protein [Streptomyces sp. HNM0645]MDI9884074.1 hypothetical protein [Streptomyces sp. HNM0645]